MTTEDLVCTRCWQHLFDTEAFERCCTYDDSNDSCNHGVVEAIATAGEIKTADCNWCAYIRTFISDSILSEDMVTIRFSPSSNGSCTPKGRNVFYLSIDCHAPDGKWIEGAALFLHAWTTPGDKASKFVTARPLQTDVSSDAAMTQLRTWWKECANHKLCSALHRNSVLPTRVIEVSPPGRKHPRVLESANQHGVYATLSYCWGERPFLTLNRSNYNDLIEDLDPSALPPTFHQAVMIARTLNIQYLWIDALCIIQDSEEDKIREITFMKSIYAASTLTIVAASASNVFEGFTHPRVHLEPSYTIPFRIQPSIFGTISVNELDAICYDERLEPLAKRAWALQEQTLAQRTLTFTSRTMMWGCPIGTRNFGDSLYFPHDLDAGYNDNDEKYSLNLHSLLLREEEACAQQDKTLSCWMRLVTAYSLRVASLERDKLNAVAGVASHPSFSNGLGPRYFAGLWQYNLARQLTWRTSRWHRILPEGENMIYRPVCCRAPSWSWASIEGGVVHFDFDFDDDDDDDDEITPQVICNIVDCSTVLRSPELNPFGEVSSGLLKVEAAVRNAWFSPSSSNIFLLPVSFSAACGIENSRNEKTFTFAEASTLHITEFMTRYPDVDLKEDPEATFGTDYRNICGRYDETGNHDPIMVLCMATTRNQERDDRVEGLLLLPSEVEDDNQVYRRIGYFERGKNEDFQTNTKTKILIV